MRAALAAALLACLPGLAGAAAPVAAERDEVPAEEEGALRGLDLSAGLGILQLPSRQPLSYSPLELGWRFASGWELGTGLGLFYDQGPDSVPQHPELGAQLYSYSMLDWRSRLAYGWRLPRGWRLLALASLDVVSGTRQLSAAGPQTSIAAYSFAGPGAGAGLECPLGRHFALGLTGRCIFSLGSQGQWLALDLGLHYLP